jgi:fused signal recognition particle receptor
MPDLLDELESTLISADIGVRTTERDPGAHPPARRRHQLGDAAELKGLIREHLLEILQASERAPARVAEPPAVVLVVGVNGSGKTTTIGKLASASSNEGARCCCAPPTRSARRPSSNWKSGASAPARR